MLKNLLFMGYVSCYMPAIGAKRNIQEHPAGHPCMFLFFYMYIDCRASILCLRAILRSAGCTLTV